MASAALDYEQDHVAANDAHVETNGHADLRIDEHAARVLLIEDRPQLARVVCWALDRAVRGHFEIHQTPVIEHVSDLLRDAVFDAILLDLGERSGDNAHEAMDVAETLSHLVPVIVLTGTRFDTMAPIERETDLAALVAREHLECDQLPCAILDAIRRHRRVGQGGAAPIIYRMHQ